MKKYHIITFGCQMNKSDSERIATTLKRAGYKKASKIEEADLAVVNMCSVRQSAVDRVLGLPPKFEKFRRRNQNLKTILTGCILKKDLKKFREHFDFILTIKILERWPEILRKKKHFYYPESRSPEFNKKFDINYFKILAKPTNNFSAFIPISAGCNNFCSYCVVPLTRGPLICRPHQDILKETKFLIDKGAKEIWLLGQNVNDYHSPTDAPMNFPELLRRANKIKGDFWIRFTSPNPKDFSDELIDVMTNSEKITEYLNLPVQSGDNGVLKRMNRPYTIEQYKSLVKKIRKKIPEISLSTDVIVGFPGESKKQFENTAKLFKEIKYDMAYIGKYSPRPHTAAFKLKDNVPHQEKERRYGVLTDILKETALENNKKYIGKEIEVLVMEHKTRNMKHFCTGKTRTYKTVKFQVLGPKFQDLVGRFKQVKITDVSPWGFGGLTNT